ncbi:uncharacterized protein BDR25DRAFT_348527 [Lindgomyces ingoldianus]|uniref:Uncharacterized protein n=1 Tax=Lindgomyces ingoldianus TaxID=673940 RepID=A0ACB6RFY2_9PLEO|nr:uncharacterized protein BDR25DRAFT_348527 [Lindgomyces ingoldianus]KAF2478264.1 hypothetical protein BDR25DRAFT_348527 [Lindgomyces ingoldianus]
MDIPSASYPGKSEASVFCKNILSYLLTYGEDMVGNLSKSNIKQSGGGTQTKERLVKMFKLLLINHHFPHSPNLIQSIPKLDGASRTDHVPGAEISDLELLSEQAKHTSQYFKKTKWVYCHYIAMNCFARLLHSKSPWNSRKPLIMLMPMMDPFSTRKSSRLLHINMQIEISGLSLAHLKDHLVEDHSLANHALVFKLQTLILGHKPTQKWHYRLPTLNFTLLASFLDFSFGLAKFWRKDKTLLIRGTICMIAANDTTMKSQILNRYSYPP